MGRLEENPSDGKEYQRTLYTQLTTLTDSFVTSGVLKQVIQNFLKSVSSAMFSMFKARKRDKKKEECLNLEFAEILSCISCIVQIGRTLQSCGNPTPLADPDSDNQNRRPIKMLKVVKQVEMSNNACVLDPRITVAPVAATTRVSTVTRLGMTQQPQSLLNKPISFTIKSRRPKQKVEIFIDSPESSRGSPDVTQHLLTTDDSSRPQVKVSYLGKKSTKHT